MAEDILHLDGLDVVELYDALETFEQQAGESEIGDVSTRLRNRLEDKFVLGHNVDLPVLNPAEARALLIAIHQYESPTGRLSLYENSLMDVLDVEGDVQSLVQATV